MAATRLKLTVFICLAALAIGAPCVAAPENADLRVGALTGFGADTISQLVEEVSPAVVNIVSMTSSGRDQLSRQHTDQRSKDESSRKTRRYFGVDPGVDESGNQMKVTGSGIVVRSDGYILTTLHVVQNATDIKVTLADRRTFLAKVAGKDGFTDLALIKIDATALQQAKFGDPERLRLGQWVIAIGNQFGLEHTVTCGLVSGLHREAKAFTPSFGARTGAVKFIQTDAPINPGSSGGPLLNLQGEVVGINSFIRDDAQNIGFALPASLARDVAEKLLLSGAIARPYIGIEMRDPSESSSDLEAGVEVTLVKPASPASGAGLEAGDLILEVDQKTVKTPDEVSKGVSGHSPGEKIVMKVKRNGAERILTIKAERLPESVE